MKLKIKFLQPFILISIIMRFTLIEMKNLDVIRVQFIASRGIITTRLKHKTEILKT